jgi:hypothetical protein
VSWLAWGSLHLVRPLAVALRPRLALRGRVDDGVPQEGAGDTVTFRADRTGELRLGSVYPGELQADGTIAIDRIPYRAMAGTLSAVVARWAPGTDPQRVLERPVLADHQAAIGGLAPSRVVRAWLIAQTVPQAGHAAAEFSRIELADGDQTLRVL